MRRFCRFGAGGYRHRVKILEPTDAQNDRGGSEPTFATARKAWASIEPLSPREIIEQNATEGLLTHRIRMRHFSGLTARHRISFRSRTFELAGPPMNPGEMNDEWDCLCRETEET